METEKRQETMFHQNKYPYNLLVTIRGMADREIPEVLTEDHLAGLEYVLSTLEYRERDILLQRYRDGFMRTEIAGAYGIMPERVRQIENKACRKLQPLAKWNYIAYGVAGYMKRIATSEYNRGYSVGYSEGYSDGKVDGAAGITKPYASDEVLNRPVESLNLSTRARSCLRLAQCKRIGDVVRLTDETISTMRQLGKVSANEIALAIKALHIEHSAWDRYLL